MFAADPIINLLFETIWLSLAILWIRCLSKPKASRWKQPSSCHKVWKMWLNKPRQFLLSVNRFNFLSNPRLYLFTADLQGLPYEFILKNFQNFFNLGIYGCSFARPSLFEWPEYTQLLQCKCSQCDFFVGFFCLGLRNEYFYLTKMH